MPKVSSKMTHGCLICQRMPNTHFYIFHENESCHTMQTFSSAENVESNITGYCNRAWFRSFLPAPTLTQQNKSFVGRLKQTNQLLKNHRKINYFTGLFSMWRPLSVQHIQQAKALALSVGAVFVTAMATAPGASVLRHVPLTRGPPQAASCMSTSY